MKKRILSLLGIIALFLGVILVSCGNDDDNKNTTGVHKIVIEQSGNTDDFDLNIAFGAANTSGVAKLYNENGEYLGDSYLVNKVTENKISCQNYDGSYKIVFRNVPSTYTYKEENVLWLTDPDKPAPNTPSLKSKNQNKKISLQASVFKNKYVSLSFEAQEEEIIK